MAIHNFEPGDESDTPVLEESGFKHAGSDFDTAKLKPKFTERTHVCPICCDRAYVVVHDSPFGVEPCPGCVRGEAILNGWWKDMIASKHRGPGRAPNQRLYADKTEDA